MTPWLIIAVFAALTGCSGERPEFSNISRSDASTGGSPGGSSSVPDAGQGGANPGSGGADAGTGGVAMGSGGANPGTGGVDAGTGGVATGGSNSDGGAPPTGTTRCSDPSECNSNFCADGYCCDTACDAVCGRCDLAQSEGTCSPVSSDAACGDPECPGDSACRSYVAVNVMNNCEALGQCVPAACMPTDAAADTPCERGGSCDGNGECVVLGKKPLGETCTTGAECGSEYCAGTGSAAVCCDQACDGLCQSCGADGHCSMAPDDERCVVSCEPSTPCVTYPDALTANRCSSFGKCVTSTAHCSAPSYAEAGTACGERKTCNGAGACETCPTATGPERACTEACPCAAGQGTCGADSQCEGDLSCVRGAGKYWGFEGDTCRPNSCQNDIMDGDETSIDCGGDCGCTATLAWLAGPGEPIAISDDGSTIIGNVEAESTAVYWGPDLVRSPLGGGEALGISENGNVIVGSSLGAAVQWLNLGAKKSLPAPDPWRPMAVSGDGSRVVGTGIGSFSAIVWNKGGTPTEVPAFEWFSAISDDGNVGFGLAPDGTPGLWSFKENRTIPTPMPSDWEALERVPTGLSRDGKKFVGWAYWLPADEYRIYLWDEGNVTTLNPFNGGDNATSVTSVSSSGRVVGASLFTILPRKISAVYWDPENNYKPRPLAELLASHYLKLGGAELSSADLITPDGKTIVGTGSNGIYKFTIH